MDIVQLYSSRVIECAQESEYSDTYKVKFIICNFEKNRNNVKLNRDKIDGWLDTLKNKPVVGKIASNGRGGMDFTGHNARYVMRKDDKGRVYKDMVFDTSAFGTFTDVDIEKIDDEECIVATCEIWKRFENACALIMKRVESGTLNTSWEIETLESHYEMEDGAKVKVLDNGVFIGHCLLGAATAPAYECSRVLEVAEATPDFDMELANAIQQDMGVFAENMEDKEVSEVKVKNITVSEDETKKPAEGEPEAKDEGEDKKSDKKTEEAQCKDDEKKDTAEADEEKKKDESPADDEGDGETETQDDPDADKTEDEKKKKETSEVEISALTMMDLSDKIRKALRLKGIDGYAAMIFPEEHEFWAKTFGPDVMELDYLRFTYTVSGDEIALSEPEKVTLTVGPKEVNSVIAERDEKIKSLNEAVATASTQMQEKDNEIASLNVYKEKFEKAEQERIAAEIAEKKENLREYAVSSGLIKKEEVCAGGELAQLIESDDEAGIKSVIAERFMEKNAEVKNAPKKEISEVKGEEKPHVDLKNYNSEPRDYGSIMKQYLGRK